MKKVTLHADLGPLILKKLSEYQELPSEGIIAGQSVASIIDHLNGYTQSPVNDIDVFRMAKGSVLKRQTSSYLGTLDIIKPHFGLDLGYEALNEFLKKMRSYRISTVSRNNLINYVNVDIPYEDKFNPYGVLTVQKIIDSFDLNCVRVGIDLASKKLIWAPQFEEFLKTREVKLCVVHTPGHSIIRALKKTADLPDTYLDFPTAATTVALFCESDLFSTFLSTSTTTNKFGSAMMHKGKPFLNEISKYFNIVETSLSVNKDQPPVSYFQLETRGQPDSTLLNHINSLKSGMLHFIAPFVHGAITKDSIKKQEPKLLEFGQVCPTSMMPYLNQNPFVFAKSKSSDKHFDTVSQFLSENTDFYQLFSSLNLNQQFEAVKLLKPLKTNNETENWVDFVKTLSPSVLANRKLLKNEVINFNKISNQPLKKSKLVLPFTANWASSDLIIEEIVTKQAFNYHSNCLKPILKDISKISSEKLFVIKLQTKNLSKTDLSFLVFKGENGVPSKLMQHLTPHSSYKALFPKHHKEIAKWLTALLLPAMPVSAKEDAEDDDLPF